MGASSAVRKQFPPPDRPPEAEAPARDQDDPIELLRSVVSRLKSPDAGLTDKAQLSELLAEAQKALERANDVGRALAESQELANVFQFDKALEVLSSALLRYPDDGVLVARQREIERQSHEHDTAARVRTVIEEGDWLLSQDRADLAVQFLRDKAAEFPGDFALRSKLEEVEALLPKWEENRNVRATLARAGTLEQPQQWEAALTALEEARQLYPDSDELLEAAQRLRLRIAVHDRQKKLERRLDRIAQSVRAQAWSQASALLESTLAEYPEAGGMEATREEIERGLRRAQFESIAAEVRQWLMDGELEEAERSLAAGRTALGSDPSLQALEREVQAERAYRNCLRSAQLFFGRRQFDEAECILADFAAEGRAEAVALLDAVRSSRTALEEEDFLERGRAKALALMQAQEFAQAADLLSNLLSLFPDDPILQRELGAAKGALRQESVPQPEPAEVAEAAEVEEPGVQPVVAPAAEEKEPVLQPVAAAPRSRPAIETAPPEPPARSEPQRPPSRMRAGVAVGVASVVLISGTGGVWLLTRNRATTSSKAATTPAAAPLRLQLPPVATQPAGVTEPAAGASTPAPAKEPERHAAQSPAKAAGQSEPNSGTKPHPTRAFVPPPANEIAVQRPVAPPPPRIEQPAVTQTNRVLPSGIADTTPAPPPPPAPAASNPAAPAAASAGVPEKPKVVVGGTATLAQLIRRTTPAYPAVARTRGISGEVKMEATIDDRGNVTNVKILSGNAILAGAAKSAVAQWKYAPGTLNGKAVATAVSIVIVFDKNQ